MRPHSIKVAWVLLLFLLTACVSNAPERRVIPRFTDNLPEPLTLRVKDSRPELDINPGVSPDWIYLTSETRDEAMELVSGVGNALNTFRATPGYRIVTLATPPDASRFMLHVEVIRAYARWPARLEQKVERVPVEASLHLRYILYRDGKVYRQGQVKSNPPPFLVPVNLVRKDNVEKIVSDSLGYQYQKATNAALDELMLILAKRWPDYAK
jgi:hypothetical protein